MSCERIREWMSDRLDGCLAAGQIAGMDAHLAGCDACRREWEDLRQTVDLIRDLPPVPPPADLLQSVHQRLARQRKSPLIILHLFLNRPEVRAVAAALFIIVIGTYGLRPLMQRPAPTETRAPNTSRPAPAVETPVVAKAAADAKPLDMPARSAPPAEKAEAAAKLSEEVAADFAQEPRVAEAPAPKPALKAADAPAASMPAATPAPALARAAAPAVEKRDGLWKDGGLQDKSRQDKEQPILGLTVGAHSAVEAESEGAGETTRRMSAATAETPAPPDSKMRSKETPARGGMDLADTPMREESGAKAVGRTMAPAGPPPQSAAKRTDLSPMRRDIVLATADAAAVRKILAPYLVPTEVEKKEVQEKKAVVADVQPADSATPSRKTDADNAVVSGWIHAADYDRLLADLKAAGIVTPPKTLPPPAKGAEKDLVFVRITLAPPAR